MIRQLSRSLEALTHGDNVVLRCEQISANAYRRVRISGAKFDLAAALGVKQRCTNTETVFVSRPDAGKPKSCMGRSATEHKTEIGDDQLWASPHIGVEAAGYDRRCAGPKQVRSNHRNG